MLDIINLDREELKEASMQRVDPIELGDSSRLDSIKEIRSSKLKDSEEPESLVIRTDSQTSKTISVKERDLR